ncbi:hypothetical protein [Achromobacter xylosoxidans]|uniref:Uncharacterized protein n=1 Tax=Alcaligenes xylosoxydans xylosoxydans TaxID=85698 RepID=A0A424W3Z1_ALCXX|nr:hypothetical protein [Achromobacter xylosoxidans]MBC9908634.1 hypothetical protein [Achromobacter xylosoxidans]MBD0872687.1 hypothetical protein [Achromobacter xylosoxidans]QNP87686.1 hypothetical protein IAG39_09310 [Achromobacter xylosoxidans]RPJ88022.1 hypothetical protein DY367_29985 [Achromobacter xylosoxidans]
MDKFDRDTTAAPAEILSEGEQRARRTLEAARRLLDPQAEPAAAVSSVEAKLQRYVRQAYHRRSYGAYG